MARDVRVAILGDARDFKRAVDSADREAGRFDGATRRMGTAAKAMGIAVAAGAAAAAVGIGKLAIDAINAGSDLEETISKADTVFGDSAFEIQQWSRSAATAFGQSREEALAAASSFGNMFVQLGIGQSDAAAMSQQMTELASDFASFHNADISQVLEAQQAAFRGEYDAVQRFVPTINAAAVEQKALEMGLADTTKELDAQDKALATQALLLEGAGDAMGDFSRTSDGLANRQRIMSARFKDLQARIGQGLIPVALGLVDVFDRRIMPVIQEVAGGIVAFVSAFRAADGDITSSGLPGFMERVGFIASQLVEKFKEYWPQIQAAVQVAIDKITEFIGTFIGYATGAWETFGADIVEFVVSAFGHIQTTIEGVMQFIEGVINVVMGIIHGDWDQAWEGIKGIVFGARDALVGAVGFLVDTIKFVISVGLETVKGLFTNIWNDIVDFVSGLPGRISGAASGMFNGIRDAFRSAINWIIDAWNRLEFRIPGFDPPGPGPTFGGFTLGVPNIPRLHSGGIFRSPSGQDEGLALLKDGERVMSPTQSMRGGSETINLVVDGKVLASVVRDHNRDFVRHGGRVA